MSISADSVRAKRVTALRASVRNVARSLFFAYRSSVSPYRHTTRVAKRVDGVEVIFSTEDLYSNIWFFPRYARDKIHEQPVTSLIVDTVKSAHCFADIGTNLGWYTCLAAKAMRNGVVYGFEMDELNVSLVRRNVELNRCTNVHLEHAAVTDAAGLVSYSRPSMNPRPDFTISTTPVANGTPRVTVKAVTLDEFFQNEGMMPDVLKIDVEGAEMNVLRGMNNLLHHQDMTMFVEIHPTNLPDFNTSVQDILTLLIDHGYDIFEIQDMRKYDQKTNLKKLTRKTNLTKNTMLFASKQQRDLHRCNITVE